MADIPLSRPLSLTLPDRVQTSLLRASLLRGREAGAAWARWLESTESPAGFLKTERLGVKGMLPLLHASLRDNRVELEAGLQTLLRTALVQEEIRAESFDRVCNAVLTALTARQLGLTVIRGTDLAYTVYHDPVLRHCDRLEIVADDPADALDVLRTLGCSQAGPAIAHPSGLGIRLHSSLPLRWLGGQDGGSLVLLDERRIQPVAGVPVRILAPEANLAFICAQAFDPAVPESLRWVCDAHFLAACHPDLQWGKFVDGPNSSALGLPLWFTFGYLRDHLNLPVPSVILETLEDSAQTASPRQKRLALDAARRSTGGGFRGIWQSAGGVRDRLFILRWMLKRMLGKQTGGGNDVSP